MATVESMTLARLLALEDSTVINGYINGSGHLILEQHDGTLIDAGDALVAIADGSITSAKLLDGTIVDADISSSAAIAQSKISGLTTSLAGKAATSHTHDGSDINAGTVAFARLPTGTTSTTVAIGNHTHSVIANLVVGDSAWINAGTFFNSWVDYNTSTHTRAQYRMTPTGLVVVQGVIKNGTIGSAAFVLPSGYRPAKTLIMPAMEGTNGIGRLDIFTDGSVIPQTGNNGYYGFAVAFYPG